MSQDDPNNTDNGLRPDEQLDEATGEIRPGRDETGPARRADAHDRVDGERTIPSVNRTQSIRARISNMLALAVIVLLGGGFLLWYYATQFSAMEQKEAAAAAAEKQRAAGEMKLPPLGRVDPPAPPAPPAETLVEPTSILGAPPPPPQAMPPIATAPQGPPQKTPGELAQERRLQESVQAGLQPASMQTQTSVDMSAMQSGMPPDAMAGLMGGAPQGTDLAGRLQPTPTPAVSALVVPTLRYLLPKGASIDCTNETAIDSTYDGIVTCIGATDVYSADGSVVLLERGTKYVGEKRGELKRGQGRVFVLWNEARTPTGVIVNLASPGTDELGRTGLPGYVDTHFWDRFGAAILISVIDGVIQGIAQAQSDSDGTTIQLNPNGSRDIMTEALKSTVNIPPTVIKNQGERIQILTARDVDFRSVYELRTTSR